jgi:Domain of unknown function (DUF4440)
MEVQVKRTFVCILLFALAMCVGLLVRAGVVVPASDAESEIRAIETAKLQYPLEPDRWAKNVSDNALFTQGNGKIITKSELLSFYENEGRTIKNSLELMEQHFKLFGDTAVFSYVYKRTRQDDSFEIHQHIRRTAVYQRSGAHWQLIQSASIAIPNADRKQKPVDAKILDQYVGLYEGNLRITRDGNRILSQDPNDKEKVELLAVTDNSFVIANESDFVLFVFEQGPDGRTQIRAHNVGGSEAVIKRID